MTASQEYQDILDLPPVDPWGLPEQGTDGLDLGDILTGGGGTDGGSGNSDQDISNAVVDSAVANVKRRNFETRQFWVRPGDETTSQNPWVYAGDGEPPNGYVAVGNGTTFPLSSSVNDGDYFLRTDYDPDTLFRRISGGWRIQETNWREQEWSPTNRQLYDFVNNNTTTTFKDGSQDAEKQAISKSVKPKADF